MEKNILCKIKQIMFLLFLFLNTSAQTHIAEFRQLTNNLDNHKLDAQSDLIDYEKILNNNQDILSLDQLKKYYKKGVTQALSLNANDELFVFSSFLTDLYMDNAETESDIDSSFHFNKMMFEVAYKVEDKIKLGHAFNAEGNIFMVDKEMLKGLESFEKAVEQYTQSNNKAQAAYTLSNISNIYANFEDYESAIKYTKQGLHLTTELPFVEKTYNSLYKYSDLIGYFDHLEKFDSSQYYLKLGLETIPVLDSLNSSEWMEKMEYKFYESGVRHYIKRNDHEKAGWFFDKVSKNRKIDGAYGTLLKMEFAIATNDLKTAENLIINAPAYLQDSSSFYRLRFLNINAKFYEKTNNHKEALKKIKEVKALSKKSEQDKIFKYTGYMQSRLELQQQQNEIESLAKENEIKSLQIKFFILGTLLFLLAAFSFFFQNRQLKSKNKELGSKNEELATQRNLIASQSKKIQEQTALKENLFGNLSHELRTPLTLILGAVGNLLNKESDKDNHKDLTLLSTYSNQLLDMTNQILDLMKSKFYTPKIQLSSFYLDEMFKFLKDEYEGKAKKQNILLVFNSQSEYENIIIADIEKILIILKNLLQNALKYSGESTEIVVSYALENGLLAINVKDTGPGIEEEALPFIFDRFYQAKSTNSNLSGGVGLGLAICKENTEILGGKISVKSKIGYGSNFYIEIPVSTNIDKVGNHELYKFPNVLPLDITTLPDIKTTDYEGDYILITEDNIDLCKYLFDILKNDYNLSFAHDGQEALKQIEHKQPKVIITDWMMKGMSGDALVKHLKSKKEYSLIPILMLTARNLDNDRKSMLRIGVDSYLTKPFVSDNLKSQLNHLISLSDKRLENTEEPQYEGFNKTDVLFLKTMEKATIENISDFNFKVSDIAEKLSVSVSHLGRKVKKLTGLTPKQYINEARFQEAKRLLESREYSTVKAVIYSVGFKDEKNFSRNFKIRFGKYPKDILY